MTEQQPSTQNTTPEQQHAVPDFLTIGAIERLRYEQELAHSNFLMNMDEEQFASYIDEDGTDRHDIYVKVIEEYLESNGIKPDDEKYNDVKNFLENASPDRISEYDWLNTQDEQGNKIPSGRSLVSKMVKQNFQWSISETSADEDTQDEPTEENSTDDSTGSELDPEKVAAIDELEGPLSELRDQMAAATAKRQDRLFGKGGKKYAELKKEYEAMVHELGRRHLALHEDFSQEDKNLVAMTVIVDEQAKLRNETIAELEGKPLGKFIKWMNKGNVATRIAKGIGLGAVAGIAGSFAAGAVGAGIVAGGAVVASRFARNFAIKDNKTRGMAAIYDDPDRGIVADDGKSTAIDFDANELNTGAALNFTDDANRMEKIAKLTGANEAFEEDTKKEQNKRLKSALFGAAMIGAGAFAGYGVHRAAEWMSDRDLTLTGYVHDKWDKFWNGDQDTYANDVDHDGIPDDKDSFVDKNNDGLDDRTGKPLDGDGTGKPEVDADGGEAGFDPSEVSHDARWVERGEGWYQTFQELGIPQDRWAETLELAGPKLHEQDWAYFDESANEWRISQPGRLSDEALSTIAGSAKQAGYDLAA